MAAAFTLLYFTLLYSTLLGPTRPSRSLSVRTHCERANMSRSYLSVGYGLCASGVSLSPQPNTPRRAHATPRLSVVSKQVFGGFVSGPPCRPRLRSKDAALLSLPQQASALANARAPAPRAIDRLGNRPRPTMLAPDAVEVAVTPCAGIRHGAPGGLGGCSGRPPTCPALRHPWVVRF